MDVVIFHVGSQGDIGSGIVCIVNTFIKTVDSRWDYLTPSTIREVKIDTFLFRQIGRLYRSLQMIAEEYIFLNDLICIRIITKVEEEWLEEAASFLVDFPELRIVVANQSIPVSDGRPDHISVGDALVIGDVLG